MHSTNNRPDREEIGAARNAVAPIIRHATVRPCVAGWWNAKRIPPYTIAHWRKPHFGNSCRRTSDFPSVPVHEPRKRPGLDVFG